MNEPTEPRPRSVYWRRRAVAIGSIAATLLLLVWGLSAFFSGGRPPQRHGGAERAIMAAGRTSPEPPSGEPAARPASAAPSASASAPPSASATSSATPSVTPSATPSATPSVTPSPAAPPPACPDSAIVLAATVGKPSYPAQARPKLGMTIISIAAAPCTRDVGRGLRNLVVRSAGGQREWANNDCYFGDPKPDVETLQPGQQLHYELNWITRTSSAGCPVHRDDVPPGKYTLTAELGDLASVPTPFTLT